MVIQWSPSCGAFDNAVSEEVWAPLYDKEISCPSWAPGQTLWSQRGMHAVSVPSASRRLPKPLQRLGNPVNLTRAHGPPLGVGPPRVASHYHLKEEEFCNSSSCPGELVRTSPYQRQQRGGGQGMEGVRGRAGAPGAIKAIESPLP